MRYPFILICLSALWACGPMKVTRQAELAVQEERWDEAYRLWSGILAEKPGDTKARVKTERARLNAALSHLQKAGIYFEKTQYPEAEFEIKLVLSYEPDNQQAKLLLKRIGIELERAAAEAEGKVQETPSRFPLLRPNTWEPQDLVFVKQSIKDIYQSLGQAYDVNIVVDHKIRDDKITLDLRNLNFLRALDTLMVLNRHFFKIIDDNTIIILEDNKSNRDRYDNQIIQTFYLSNVTPKDLKNHLRVLLGIKEYAENERLNAITIKGTPNQIALAEKMISSNDKAQPEVIIEIEILEVTKSNLRRLGIKPVNPTDGSPAYQAGIIADPLNRSDDDRDQNGLRGFFPSLKSNDFLTIVPAIAIDFLKEYGDSIQVANPHLRVTSGESGMVRIGQKIPIVQTSFTNAQISGSTAGGTNFGDQALTTFNYNDVGIKIDLTPRVHFNNEITLAMDLEVSTVLAAGLQPILGQRQVTTNLRLKNGETNVLAGMLTNEERKSMSGFPGLSDIPIIGRLFSNEEKIISQTDIIMTIRPVIVRGTNITDEDRAPHELSTLRLSTLYGDGSQAARDRTQPKSAPAVSGSSAQPREQPQNRAFDPEHRGRDPEEDPFYEEEDAGEPEEPAPAMLSFSPINGEARQDDILEFQLFMANVADMKQGEIALSFDPEILRADSVEVGALFGGRKRPLVTADWDNRNGRIAIIITQRGSEEPLSGSGILATLRFLAKAPGSGALSFHALNLEAADGRIIPTQGLEASFEVYP